MATDPTFFSTPMLTQSTISATAYGGTRTSPTGTTLIYTASTTLSTLIRRIEYKNLGTSVAGFIDLWISTDGGSTFGLLPYASAVTAITGSTTVDPWQASVIFDSQRGLFLPAAGTALRLYAGATVTQTTAILCTVYGSTS